MYISDEVASINGITQSKAEKKGIDPEIIITNFINDIKNVDIIVGHNVDFHLKTILAEAVRYNININISKYIIIDTISFFHDYGYLKLEDLSTKLKINNNSDESYDKLDLIIIVFMKLYKKYEKSLK